MEASNDRLTLGQLLIRTRKGRMLILAVFLGLLVLVVPLVLRSRKGVATGTAAGAGKPAADLPPSPTGFKDTITLGEKYDALISRWGSDLSVTKTELETTRKELTQLRASLKAERAENETQKRELGNTLRELREGLGRELRQNAALEPAPGTPLPGNPGAAPSPVPAGALRVIDLGPQVKTRHDLVRPVRIVAASGGIARLMNGVFAPVSGEPSPVRLRLEAALIGPNHSRIPLKDAYLIGKAIGDPNAQRVSVQLEKLSYVKESGEAIEVKAHGYVVGEDGLEGIPGSYEWRAWELAPLAVGAGGLQGLSGALAQSQTTTTANPLGGATTFVTGDALKYAGFQAGAGASGKLGEIVTDRMKEIRPAVSTPARSRVTVVFLEGVTLDGLDAQEIDHARQNDPYRGLDAHR